MRQYISEGLRTLVTVRADFRCEYCQLPDSRSFFAFHIDHILSLKHGGQTTADNLAYSCAICNLSKGPDVATFLAYPGTLIRFYNPRIDHWADHFRVEPTGFLTAKTSIGTATTRIIDLNHPDSIIERLAMLRLGLLTAG
jgi:hypothetical protein